MSSNETLIPLWPPPKPPASRKPWIAAAVIGLLIAAAMAFLWLSARGDIDDRTLERDTAIAERDAVNATKIENDAELESLRNDMAAAQAALDEAQSNTTDTPTAEEVADAQAAIDELNSEIERLNAENEALQEEVVEATTTTTTTTGAEEAAEADEAADESADADAADEAPAEQPADEAVEEAAEQATTTTAPTAELADPDEVGDQLGSLYRDNVLGDLQKRCLADFALGNLGNDQVVSILAADDAAQNEELEASLRLAADFCLIAPSAVFGD